MTPPISPAVGEEPVAWRRRLRMAPSGHPGVWLGPVDIEPPSGELIEVQPLYTRSESDRIKELEAMLEEAREALEPFAAYSQQMDAYAAFHRGGSLPDDKILAYSQTEMGTCAALVIGHFRDADAVFGKRAKGWTGLYRTRLRQASQALDKGKP